MSNQQSTVLTVLNGGYSNKKSKRRYDDLADRATIDLEYMKDYPKSIKLFTASITEKVGCSNNERAYSLMMIGIARYFMRKYKGSKESLSYALMEATDPILVNRIKYNLAMTNLFMGTIYKSERDDLSWLTQVSISNRLKYTMRLLPVAVKTKDLRYFVKIISHITSI